MAAVIVVGQDQWRCRGLADGLREVNRAGVTIRSLDDGCEGLESGAVVLLDPFDPLSWDRWRGLSPQWILGPEGRAVRVVVCTDVPMGPIVRQRAAEVGATAMVQPRSLAGAAALDEVGRRAATFRRVAPTPTELARVGARPGGRPGACIELVRTREVEEAFVPGRELATTGLSRRTAIRLRADLSRIGRLSTAPGRSAGGPERDLTLPTWREVALYVNRARGVECGIPAP